MNKLRFAIVTAATLSAAAAAQNPAYQVTFNVSTELQNVFVSAHEFNGAEYAWDLFPIALGTVKAGKSTFALGSHDAQAWAVFADYTQAGVAAGISDAIDPPDGVPFESVFPGYAESQVAGNIAGLFVGGAYNVPEAYFLVEFVIANEDALKSDGPTTGLAMYAFSNGVKIGTATFEPAVACYPDFTGDGTLDLFDFLAYVNAFNAGDAAADCDGAGGLDLFDFLCFVNAFNAGC